MDHPRRWQAAKPQDLRSTTYSHGQSWGRSEMVLSMSKSGSQLKFTGFANQYIWSQLSGRPIPEQFSGSVELLSGGGKLRLEPGQPRHGFYLPGHRDTATRPNRHSLGVSSHNPSPLWLQASQIPKFQGEESTQTISNSQKSNLAIFVWLKNHFRSKYLEIFAFGSSQSCLSLLSPCQSWPPQKLCERFELFCFLLLPGRWGLLCLSLFLLFEAIAAAASKSNESSGIRMHEDSECRIWIWRNKFSFLFLIFLIFWSFLHLCNFGSVCSNPRRLSILPSNGQAMAPIHWNCQHLELDYMKEKNENIWHLASPCQLSKSKTGGFRVSHFTNWTSTYEHGWLAGKSLYAIAMPSSS